MEKVASYRITAKVAYNDTNHDAVALKIDSAKECFTQKHPQAEVAYHELMMMQLLQKFVQKLTMQKNAPNRNSLRQMWLTMIPMTMLLLRKSVQSSTMQSVASHRNSQKANMTDNDTNNDA